MAVIDVDFVVHQDSELRKSGLRLYQRPFHVALAWMEKQGLVAPLIDDAVYKQLMVIYRELYPSGDFGMPALFEGGVALRDQMYKVCVKVGFGQFAIDPIDCIQITKQEIAVVYHLEPAQYWMAFYGVGDIIDFAYGTDDLGHSAGFAPKLLSNARSHIAATARVLHANIDIDSAVQSACLSAELAMKGALAHLMWTEARIRKLSHSLADAAEALIGERPSRSDARLRKACGEFPDYISTRYSSHGLNRHELLMLAMRAQFVAADAVRRITSRDIGSQLENDQKTPPRIIP